MIESCKLRAGSWFHPARLEYRDSRIWFLDSPFALKDEIKAMKGARWHGYDATPLKMWSVSDCPRNRFQLDWLKGGNPYAPFERPLIEHTHRLPLLPHQRLLADSVLTYRRQVWAAWMGTGKTMAFQAVAEAAGGLWWFVTRKKLVANTQRELRKWDNRADIRVLSYEQFTKQMDQLGPNQEIPLGLGLDEVTKVKNAAAQVSRAAQMAADLVRERGGYVVPMTGTPAPKTPDNWWSLCEIACPGFLREGSELAFRNRLALLGDRKLPNGTTVPEVVGWNLEEVAALDERLKGLVVKVFADVLNLPPKTYRKVYCKPTSSTLRVAQAVAGSVARAADAACLLRELSDGFQYREEPRGLKACICDGGQVTEWLDPAEPERVYTAIEMLDPDLVSRLQTRQAPCHRCEGTGKVPKMFRVARQVGCPKEPALVQELEGLKRIVVYAGFKGSVDRCVKICQAAGWAVVRCDGDGMRIVGQYRKGDPLDFWEDMSNERVAFVAHPESGGLGLTLVQAKRTVFWSNSFKPEYRIQAEARIHRMGQTEPVEIIDLIHLPTDETVLESIRESRKLELMTLGELTACLEK